MAKPRTKQGTTPGGRAYIATRHASGAKETSVQEAVGGKSATYGKSTLPTGKSKKMKFPGTQVGPGRQPQAGKAVRIKKGPVKPARDE